MQVVVVGQVLQPAVLVVMVVALLVLRVLQEITELLIQAAEAAALELQAVTAGLEL
jgi:hypothetical protein